MSHRLFLLVLVFVGLATFAVANPLPLVNQPLSPTAAAPGGSGFSLSVSGTGFVNGAVVNWNGSPRTTTFVSQTHLQAAVRAADIATARTASITVTNPAPGGGVSNAVFFPVSSPTASLSFTLSSISFGVMPVAVTVGDFNGDKKMDL